jgi:prolipoprotein diacylglyceryltransferase
MVSFDRMIVTQPSSVQQYTYSFIMAFATAVGLLWMLRESPDLQRHPRINVVIGMLTSSVIFSRLSYVALNWDYYHMHPTEIIQIPLGGLWWTGAVLGWFIALVPLSQLARETPGELSDGLLPLVVCLWIGGWLGSWMIGANYGSLTESWWGIPSADESRIYSDRVPVQVVAASISLFLYWFIDRSSHAKRCVAWFSKRGMKTSWTTITFLCVMLIVSLLRNDPGKNWHNIRWDVWITLIFLSLAIVVVIINVFHKSNWLAKAEDHSLQEMGK